MVIKHTYYKQLSPHTKFQVKQELKVYKDRITIIHDPAGEDAKHSVFFFRDKKQVQSLIKGLQKIIGKDTSKISL